MTDYLGALAARRRIGMRPGLETIRSVCAALGDPQRSLRAIHVAGTNGKGAVCAIIDSCLRAGGLRIGRYTSPHLVRINERFMLDGRPFSDDTLQKYSNIVHNAISCWGQATKKRGLSPIEVTFFEALTAVAFAIYADERPDFVVLETGLGGRLDATNVCEPVLCAITRIGLDHCDWLGDSVEKIAEEKAGIIKPGVPVVLGRNEPPVVAVVKARADEVGAPFFYAPDLADELEIPDGFSLEGAFNRENGVTALAVLKVLGQLGSALEGFRQVVWPGRFQRVGRFIVDGAHNPPAARALATALGSVLDQKCMLIAGFCGDKDVEETLRMLKPHVARAIAVRTTNPRSLSPEALVCRMESAGIPATACETLKDAIDLVESERTTGRENVQSLSPVLICGSLFLAGESLVELGAYPWGEPRYDPSERLHS